MIRRRLLNFAALVSALLSLAAAIMWMRSGYAADVWELRPRSALKIYPTWCRHRIVQPPGGCRAWITYDQLEYTAIPPPAYLSMPLGLAPGQRGRYDERAPRELLPPLTDHGR